MTVLSPPDRSLDQRFAALIVANDIRTRRATLKRDVKAKRVDVVPLLLSPPQWLVTMKVYDLLLALPKHGRVKALGVLNQEKVSLAKTVGGLSERQRTALVKRLQVTR